MNVLAQAVAWLNAVANAVGRLVLAPVGLLPGWLSATMVAIATGLGMLIVFKHTSNQRAIKAVRDEIKANLLSLKFFKDNVAASLRAQGRLLLGALRLMGLAVAPMLVMMVPMTLLLAQLGLWYQARPLQKGEEAVMTMTLADNAKSQWPTVTLQPSDGLEVITGPVRVLSKRELCWNIRGRTDGLYHLAFQVDGVNVDKELAVGDGFMRVSRQRPSWSWSEMLLDPWEAPFNPDSPVQSLEIDYPKRSAWTYGSDSWIIYWFVVSLVAAFCLRGVVGVNL